MEDLEFHFLHGFLGEPSDWKDVLLHLPSSISVKNHSLLEFFASSPEKSNFDSWAERMNEVLRSSSRRKIGVGYSLGGRLLLHLDWKAFDAVVLLAAHPGLLTGQEERLLSDQKWLEKANVMDQKQWLDEWNKQEVFKHDRQRPRRQWSDDVWRIWLKALSSFSLGHQKPQDDKLKEFSKLCFWLCGEDDSKFLKLIPRLEKSLMSDHIWTVPRAGHGLIFDNPKYVAQSLIKVVDSVR